MSYEFYKILHILGLLLLFAALGAALLHNMRGETRATNPQRKLIAATHGVALALMLVAGFGLMARTGIASFEQWPPWIWPKILIWVVLGASLALIQRRPGIGKWLWFALPLLAIVAVAMAVAKPGI